MTRTDQIFGRNQLLRHLSKADGDHLMQHAKVVWLARGQELYRAGKPLAQVYFPLDAVCSVLITMSDGSTLEAASIGYEGLLGSEAYLGDIEASHTAVVQIAGSALRLPPRAFRQMTNDSRSFERLIQQYISYSWHLAKQGIACNALHSVQQRACRWLLMTHDRVKNDRFELTHDLFAQMLAVHRPTVSVIAAKLQRAGWIEYHRGVISIRDRRGIERCACECYALLEELYARLLLPARAPR